MRAWHQDLTAMTKESLKTRLECKDPAFLPAAPSQSNQIKTVRKDHEPVRDWFLRNEPK